MRVLINLLRQTLKPFLIEPTIPFRLIIRHGDRISDGKEDFVLSLPILLT
jgi:hypothetical protein